MMMAIYTGCFEKCFDEVNAKLRAQSANGTQNSFIFHLQGFGRMKSVTIFALPISGGGLQNGLPIQ